MREIVESIFLIIILNRHVKYALFFNDLKNNAKRLLTALLLDAFIISVATTAAYSKAKKKKKATENLSAI